MVFLRFFMVLVVLALFPGPSGSMAPPSGVPGSKIYDFLRSRVTPSGVPGSKIYDFMRSRVPLRSRVSPSGVPGSKIYDFIRSRVSPQAVQRPKPS